MQVGAAADRYAVDPAREGEATGWGQETAMVPMTGELVVAPDTHSTMVKWSWSSMGQVQAPSILQRNMGSLESSRFWFQVTPIQGMAAGIWGDPIHQSLFQHHLSDTGYNLDPLKVCLSGTMLCPWETISLQLRKTKYRNVIMLMFLSY